MHCMLLCQVMHVLFHGEMLILAERALESFDLHETRVRTENNDGTGSGIWPFRPELGWHPFSREA